MNHTEAMKARHSVRQYKDRPLGAGVTFALKDEIDACNRESGLHIQLVTNEPNAFDGFMAHYGKFSGVTNYIAMIGKKGPALDETCGYYGERLVLYAQQLGLNTCWVAMNYSKIPNAFIIDKGEKLTVVIALGFGKTQGVEHKSKAPEKVSNLSSDSPEWFRNGILMALLAPTAMNQQKFFLTYENDCVIAKSGIGFFSKIDLGIVKYHFELGAGKENFIWRQE